MGFYEIFASWEVDLVNNQDNEKLEDWSKPKVEIDDELQQS